MKITLTKKKSKAKDSKSGASSLLANSGYNMMEVKVPRSRAWLDLVVPKYHRGPRALMSFLHEIWRSGNPKGVRLALELSKQLNVRPEPWVVDACIQILKTHTRKQVNVDKISRQNIVTFNKLERWNALLIAKEEDLIGLGAVNRAIGLLDAQGAKCGISTLNNSYYAVEKAMTDKEERRKYLIAAIPSPEEQKKLHTSLTTKW